MLFIDNLVDRYLAAIEQIDQVSGMTFNIGGGPANTLSLLEFLDLSVMHGFAESAQGIRPFTFRTHAGRSPFLDGSHR